LCESLSQKKHTQHAEKTGTHNDDPYAEWEETIPLAVPEQMMIATEAQQDVLNNPQAPSQDDSRHEEDSKLQEAAP
jgi:hypothetical protein